MNRIVISRDVIFKEHEFPLITSHIPIIDHNDSRSQIHMELIKNQGESNHESNVIEGEDDNGQTKCSM